MARFSSLMSDISLDEVMRRLRRTVGFWRVQKWLVIWNLLVDPRPLKEIALHVGLAWQTTRNLVSAFNLLGPAAIEGPGKGGRRREYMSLEAEREFLRPFFEQAGTGQIATAMQIKRALEERLGHSVHKTTVYRLLDRHAWRKIVPRPFHNKGRPEQQEEFKKNSRHK